MLPMFYDPFSLSPMRSLRRDLDRVFEDFFKELETPSWPETAELAVPPRLDLVEKPEGYEIQADLPGVDPKDLKVTVSGNTLRIEGETREERAEGEPEGKTYMRERRWQRYQRSITLPEDIDASKVQANLKHGVLRLSLPKIAEARARTIEVKVEGERAIEAKPSKQIEVATGEKKKVA